MSEYVLTDKALREAAAQVRNAMLSTLPSPSECEHEFSPAFEEKMARLIDRIHRKEHWQHLTRQVAAVFLALLIGSGVWLSVDSEARANFVAWLREVYEDSVFYRFHTSSNDIAAPLPLYEIGWLPEGYEKTREYSDNDMYNAVYKNLTDVKNSSSNNIVFEYRYMTDYTNLIGDFENYTTETLTINGMTAHFYQANDSSDTNNLIWIDEENNIFFKITTLLEKPVIIHIAESTKLSEVTN